jgi:hypothetical protein
LKDVLVFPEAVEDEIAQNIVQESRLTLSLIFDFLRRKNC